MPATPVYVVTIRGESATLDPTSLTARDGSVVRRATREAGIGTMSLAGLMAALGSPDISDLDLVAVLFWLARRQGGIVEKLADVVDAMPTYGDLMVDPDAIAVVERTPDELDGDDRAALETADSPLA